MVQPTRQALILPSAACAVLQSDMILFLQHDSVVPHSYEEKLESVLQQTKGKVAHKASR